MTNEFDEIAFKSVAEAVYFAEGVADHVIEHFSEQLEAHERI